MQNDKAARLHRAAFYCFDYSVLATSISYLLDATSNNSSQHHFVCRQDALFQALQLIF